MKKIISLCLLVIINFSMINTTAQTGANTSPESTGATNAAGVNIVTPSTSTKVKRRTKVKVQKTSCTSTDIECLEQQRKNSSH